MTPNIRSAALVVGSLGLAVLACVALGGCGGPPQMGADEEAFRAVDALFTALTARDEKLLGECEARLSGLEDSGKLPAAASAYLDTVIRGAREGRWQSAAERLYDFMREQRREGRKERRGK